LHCSKYTEPLAPPELEPLLELTPELDPELLPLLEPELDPLLLELTPPELDPPLELAPPELDAPLELTPPELEPLPELDTPELDAPELDTPELDAPPPLDVPCGPPSPDSRGATAPPQAAAPMVSTAAVAQPHKAKPAAFIEETSARDHTAGLRRVHLEKQPRTAPAQPRQAPPLPSVQPPAHGNTNGAHPVREDAVREIRAPSRRPARSRHGLCDGNARKWGNLPFGTGLFGSGGVVV
jgi:hypothetical protein